jgi:hypothetical protein
MPVGLSVAPKHLKVAREEMMMMKIPKSIRLTLCLATCLGLLPGTAAFAADALPDVLPPPDGKAADMSKPVQVYILMGQSNMLGFGKIEGGEGSLTHAVKTKGLYPYLIDGKGNWTTRKDVRFVRVMCSGNKPAKTFNNEWMTITKSNIGPEIGIGHYLGHVTDAPVLILKSCIGNRSLGWDLLPPGSPPYTYEGKQIPGYGQTADGRPKEQAGDGWYAGIQYDGDVAAAKKVLEDLETHYPGATEYEVAGFFWWQGDKDFRNNAHAAKYEENLMNLIEALRKDFNAPDAKFVAATLGQTKKGAEGNQGKILNAVMNIDGETSKYPQNQGLVASVYTHPLSKGGSSSGHYGGNAETYQNVGEAMGKAMAQLLLKDPEHDKGSVAAASKEEKPKNSKKTDPYQNLDRQNFMLSPQMISRTLQSYALKEEGSLRPEEEFLLNYFSKDWDRVAVMMDDIPKDRARRVYDRILQSLTGRETPLLTPLDLVSLMRISPSPIEGGNIDRFAKLIMATTLPEEEYMLAQVLKADEYIGGGDPKAKNLLIGRILMRTSFRNSALQFLPSVEETKKLKDKNLRDEILAFHAESNTLEQAEILDLSNTLNEKFKVLLTGSKDANAKESAMNELVNNFFNVSPAIINTITTEMLKHDRELTAKLMIKNLEKMSYAATRDRNGKNHRHNLDVLTDMAIFLNQEVDPNKQPWKAIADMMADVWLQEVEYTLKQWPEHLKRRHQDNYEMPFANPNHLIATVPTGPWTKSLSPDKRTRISLRLPRVTMISDDPEAAINMILRMATSDRKASIVLAQEFVTRWTDIHNPEIPDHVIKKFGLPQDSSIVVTPLMIDRNLDGFAKIMKLLRDNDVVPTNHDELVAAFGACYGDAEIYKMEDIERVFGPFGDMSDSLFAAIVNNMTANLGGQWRDMKVQRKAVTNRRQADLLEMTRQGYRYVIELIDKRVEANPKDWRALSAAGTLLSDWGDYEYFQTLTLESNQDRMTAYKEKNSRAYDYFRRAADAYVEEAMNNDRVDNTVFFAWFDSLLGFNSNGEINLSKAMNREVLEQMRGIMRRLPDAKLRRHVDNFAKRVESKTEDKKNPLPPELKYKYLASGLVITRDSPFAIESEKQVAYYNELLKEVRLKTAIDGPNTIWRKEDFGIVISLVHSNAMADLIDFGKYLGFSSPPKKKSAAKIRSMDDEVDARNELEKNILDSLGNFFEVKSVTFSPADVQPRTIDKPGWSETVLAYVQVRARGVSVDRVPPIEMDLDYFDLSGPVAIPVTSAETLLQMQEERTTKRPYSDVTVTQILDTRQLFVNGRLALKVIAAGNGLMPGLDDLVDLEPLKASAPIEEIEEETEGAIVKELNVYGDRVGISSTREWSLILDSKNILDADSLVAVRYPTPRDASIVLENQVYRDVEILPVDGAEIFVGDAADEYQESSETPIVSAPEKQKLWLALAIGAALVIIVILLLIRKAGRKGERKLKASDVFKMPDQVDGFVAVRILRSMTRSNLVKLTGEQKKRIEEEIQRIEAACFNPSKQGLPEEDLKKTLKTWLKEAC